MAISNNTFIGNGGISGQATIASNTSGDAWYMEQMQRDQMRRYEEERKYLMEMERAKQQMYDPYTNTYGGVTEQQRQETVKPKKAAQPEYLTNQKLLLLGETS